MGARQSKRSVDITTTPKKGDGEVAVEGEGKVEKIAEIDAKAATNGAIHTEIEYADKEDETTTTKEDGEKADVDIKENGVSESEDAKTPEGDASTTAAGDQLNESAVVVSDNKSPVEEISSEKIEETPENKKNKEKSKKKKWSFRSISFSKKDKSKPNKDSEKNGDVKEVAEENVEEAVTSPSAETPKSEEAVKSPEVAAAPAAAPATNGDATAEEVAKVVEEPAKPVEEKAAEAKAAVEPETNTVPEPVKETPPAESAPSPVKEEVKLPVEEPTPKSEEPVVEAPVVVEETKEVRSTEEIPPPLPTSNPPSPVTVFAESTKADPVVEAPPSAIAVAETVSEPDNVIVDDVPQAAVSPIAEKIDVHDNTVSSDPIVVESTGSVEAVIEESKASPAAPVVEPEIVPISSLESASAPDISQNVVEECPIVPPASPPPEIPSPVEAAPEIPKEIEPEVVASPTPDTVSVPEDSVPEPVSVSSEPIVNAADSLPDISTESLPSLPEPVSDSLPEPMSLPPVENLPEPIAITTDESLPPAPPSPVAEIPLPAPTEIILTNGNTNGLPSPINNDVTLPPVEGPLKQVPTEVTTESKCEVAPSDNTASESTNEAVEE